MSGLFKFSAGLFLVLVGLSLPVVREIMLAVIIFSVTWIITVNIWSIAWAIIFRLLELAGLMEVTE